MACYSCQWRFIFFFSLLRDISHCFFYCVLSMCIHFVVCCVTLFIVSIPTIDVCRFFFILRLAQVGGHTVYSNIWRHFFSSTNQSLEVKYVSFSRISFYSVAAWCIDQVYLDSMLRHILKVHDYGLVVRFFFNSFFPANIVNEVNGMK